MSRTSCSAMVSPPPSAARADWLTQTGRSTYSTSGAGRESNPLDETLDRWGVGLGSAGPGLSAATRARLAEAGREFHVYDTAKIANILFQLDGNSLCHFDHPELVHIGGLSHFLSPGEPGAKGGEEATPRWGRVAGVKARLEVTRYTAALLRSSIEQRPIPPLPSGLDPPLQARLEGVRAEVTDLVDRYRWC